MAHFAAASQRFAFESAAIALGLIIAGASVGAQPNLAIMRVRTIGLTYVAASVSVEISTPDIGRANAERRIGAAVLKAIQDQGVPSRPIERAETHALLLRVKANCESKTPICAVVILYSRFQNPASTPNSPESFVWLVGPSLITGKAWTAAVDGVSSFASEGALVAASLVRRLAGRNATRLPGPSD